VMPFAQRSFFCTIIFSSFFECCFNENFFTLSFRLKKIEDQSKNRKTLHSFSAFIIPWN
jgi:hypothetical protein